jgi:5-bromo-4-chloroindolyl phosphate hydrolysis protein
MDSLIRRGRAWAPTVKAAALVMLPIPLLFASLGALIAGDLTRLALTSGALASLWGAAMLAGRGLAAEARYFLGERADPPAAPLKLLSAGLTAAGAALTAVAGGHTPAGALVFAGIAAGGHVAFYGLDVRRPRITVAAVDGIDRAAVTLQLKQAYGRLRGIETAAGVIPVAEFRERLARITAIGRSILGEIERDPAEAGRARRFLNLYLDSAERVTVEYARTHRGLRAQPLEQRFRDLLTDMESTFETQHRKLLERDLVSLEVDIEVLNARLTRDGLS